MPIAYRLAAPLLLGLAATLATPADPGRAADLPPPVAGTPAPLALPSFVRVGVTAAIEDATLVARFGGVTVPGGGGSIAAEPAAYVEAGTFLTQAIAISLAGGYPPTFATKGTGTLAPFGTLYKAVVGLPVLEATYHVDLGAVRPYAGLGVGYAIVFRNEAGSVASPHLRDRAALVLLGGVDYALTPRWGVFVDVKKAFLVQRFAGLAAPAPGAPPLVPVSASVRSDPLLVSTGVSYRF